MHIKKKKKEKYDKPEVVYRKKIEVLASVCDTDWLPDTTCQTAVPACTTLRF